MPRDLEGLADIVVLTVKNAMAPMLERMALLERENTDLRAGLAVVTELRDRVVVMETKASMPITVMHDTVEPDLSPALDRIAVVELSAASVTNSISELREKVAALETKRPDVVAAGLTLSDVELAIVKRVDPVVADVSSVRERVGVLEVRAPVPGPPGQDGSNGVNGKDGLDGLGFDDYEEESEDEGRVIVRRFKSGARVKEFRHHVWPVLYRGVYIDGKSYDRGDSVTWAGSQWHANETTSSKPGEGSKAWTLMVKRGRDGKDGRDALEVPVVRSGR